MKRLWNAIGKDTKSSFFQKKAIRHVEKMEKGEVKISAPRHEHEKEHFERALKDENLRKVIAEKCENLIENVNQLHIKSVSPPERWTSSKGLPTRDSEWVHRNDPALEFGFYEPPLDKIPPEKLLFREALELLRMKQELEDKDATPAGAKRRELAQKSLEEHEAHKRISMSQLDLFYKYFRPFERRDKQRVVNKWDLSKLQERLQGWHDPDRLKPMHEGFTGLIKEQIVGALEKDQTAKDAYEKLNEAERTEYINAVNELREEQKSRLEKRLGEVKKIEEETMIDGTKNRSEVTRLNQKRKEE